MKDHFKTIHRVQFSETDMAGMVHFSNFFRYMERVEHEFYRSLGFSVLMKQISRSFGLPRVHAACRYKSPLKFEDEVEIHLYVQEIRHKTIHYCLRFYNLSNPGDPPAAEGELTVICVENQDSGKMKAVPIPDEMKRLLSVHPEFK
ncbi:MAG TPA: acyl-CoA thioesterase [Verrucomicrobiales bacterium]|nr:acyl-CoA thioesterase [Verrucomicrobiales bacterium]